MKINMSQNCRTWGRPPGLRRAPWPGNPVKDRRCRPAAAQEGRPTSGSRQFRLQELRNWLDMSARALNPSEAARRFAEDGFVALDGLFSEEEIRPISDEVDKVIERRVDYVPQRDLLEEPGSNPPRLRNAFRLHLYNSLFLEAARHLKLVSAVDAILGRPLRLYSSQLFAKPAAVGTAVPRHQDMAY